MPIDDVSSGSGEGTVVTGRVVRGILKVGAEIEIGGVTETVRTICTADVAGTIERPEGVGRVMPGDDFSLKVTLATRSPWRPGCASRSVRASGRYAPVW